MPNLTSHNKDIDESPEEPTSAKPVNEYILFYRVGNQPNCQKGFRFAGNIYEANIRAKKHCELMNYRFIFVRPFFNDFDADEKAKILADSRG